MKSQPQSDLHFFKLPYQECKNHQQKLNYICLDQNCLQKSLICSICKDEPHHAKHPVRPLKFYLNQLQQKYQKPQANSNLNTLLQQLQLSQFTFYEKLKKAVEQVAIEFQKLQQSVTEQISKIRNQIFQQMAKQNRFNEFYQNLKRGNIDQSNFLVQNYLPQTSVGKIQNLEALQNLCLDICTQINETKQKLISRQSTEELGLKQKKQPKLFLPLDLNVALKKPQNILFEGNVLKPKSFLGGKSLCLIDYPIQKMSGRLGFKMIQMKKGANVNIGIIPKKIYESMNEMWVVNKLEQGCYVLGNIQYNYGWQKCEIVQFSQSSNLQLSYKGGQIKINQKNKSCKAKLSNNDVELFVVISLTGEVQIRVTNIN